MNIHLQDRRPDAPFMSWDERRQLVDDILTLTPPDMAGIVLLLDELTLQSTDQNPIETLCIDELPSHPVHPHVPQITNELEESIHLRCTFELDKADSTVLIALKNYVNACYLPHYFQKINCNICEGLWSGGRVIACGNDDCPTRVHEECFGTLLRRQIDGPWYCPSCLMQRQLMCSICMQYNGALKPLSGHASNEKDEQKWVHALCALAIPELIMRDVPTLEPVDNFDLIENGRFRYLCCVCRKRGGASIICEQEGCNVGMHPYCAASANLMIGNESNPLALYCEKHLPEERIQDAKRWISEEDLMEEIISNESVSDLAEAAEGPMQETNEKDSYHFVLESTAGIHAMRRRKLPVPLVPVKRSLEGSEDMSGKHIKLQVATDVPALNVMGMKTATKLIFPPYPFPSVGVPQHAKLIGAIVDFYAKEQSEWLRATIMQYDSARDMYLIQFVTGAQRGWTAIDASNVLVLYLPHEEHVLEGPRVRLYRPVYKGVAEWRPRPRVFA